MEIKTPGWTITVHVSVSIFGIGIDIAIPHCWMVQTLVVTGPVPAASGAVKVIGTKMVEEAFKPSFPYSIVLMQIIIPTGFSPPGAFRGHGQELPQMPHMQVLQTRGWDVGVRPGGEVDRTGRHMREVQARMLRELHIVLIRHVRQDGA